MPKVRSSGVDINYDEWGEGPALVLVHANPFDNTLWMYQIAHFSTFYRVISVDVRGYGRTGNVDSEFTIDDLSKDVLAVCKHCGVNEAVFGGISVGAAVIQQLAADNHQMVRALILAGTGYLDPEKPILFAEKRAKEYGQGINFREEHMSSLVSQEFQHTELGSYLLSTFLERNPITSAATIRRLFQGYAKWKQPELAGLKSPILILVGEQDAGINRTIELHNRLPESEMVVIKKAGHACCLERPWEFDAAMTEFLKRHKLLPSF
jgi:3-oxoadipate enol-lactonase